MIDEAPGRSPGIDPEVLGALRSRLEGFVERGELAGVVTLASRGGEVFHSEAIGWRDMESRSPMRMDTLFRIASMSKPVTSVLALMLMEEGRLDLSDPVTRWIPELADMRVLKDPAGSLADTVQAHRDITVEDLMTHRSGIAYAPFSEGPIKAALEQALGDPGLNRKSVDEWLGALGSLPLSHQPGDRFHYGHSTEVLGFLIGRLAGKPFREVLLERLLLPLGMTDTDFWMPEEKRHRLASLYAWEADADRLAKIELEMYAQPPAYTPGGGGLISSASDYHRFVRMLLNEGELDGVRILKPETVRLMQRNRLKADQRHVLFAGMDLWSRSGFGLGVAITEDLKDNPYGCGSVGSITWPGVFGTWWQADPAEDLALIYLIQHQVPVSANSGSTIATGRGAAGRQALPVFQRHIYDALEGRAE